MRLIYFLILLAFLGAVGIFAWQNQETVSLRFFQQNWAYPLSLIIIAGYFLGMLSGWTVLGFLKSSYRRAMERPRDY